MTDVPRVEVREFSNMRDSMADIPQGVYLGANRYDTDDEMVLTIWREGHTVDIRIKKD